MPGWRGAVLTLFCALGCLALLVGLVTHGVTVHARRQLLVPVAFFVVAWAGLHLAARFGPRWVAAAVLAVLVGLFGPGAVATLLLTGATALALGLLVFGPPARPGALGPLLRVAAGLALMVAVLQPAMHVPVNWAPVYLAVGAVALLAARRDLTRLAASAWTATAAPRPAGLRWPVLLLAGLLTATLHAMGPESGYDALSNHLIIPRWVAWHGAWHFDVALFDRALMPRGAGWLFTWTHLLGGEAATRLFNAAAFWLTAALVLAAATADARDRPSEAPPAWLVPAGLMALVLTPLTVWVMAQLFEETVTTLFVTAALVSLLLAWRDPAGRTQAMMTFLLLGAACAAKVQALFFGAIGVVAVLALFRGGRPPGRALVLAVAGSAIFAAVGLVPYLHALLVTGNPFFPFGLHEPPDSRWIGLLGPDLLLRMAFETSRFMESRDGAFGFQHLVLIPLLLAAGLLSPRAGPRIVAGVLLLFGAALLSQTQYARYLFYGMPALLLLLGPAWALLGARRDGRIGVGQALLLAGLALGTALNVLAYRALYTPPVRPHAILQPERFTRGVPEERRLVEAINATHGTAARVYFAGAPLTAGLLGQAVTVYGPLRRAIEQAATPEAVEALLRANGITHVVTATPLNHQAPPVPVAPVLAQALEGRLQEVPLALPLVRLFVVPPR